MRTLDNSVIRKFMEIGKDIPIYHTDHKVLQSILNQVWEQTGHVEVENALENRPFDEMVISLWSTTNTPNSLIEENYDFYFVIKFNKDGSFFTMSFTGDGSPVLASQLSEGLLGYEKWASSVSEYIITMFLHRQTKIFLCENVVKRKNKKGSIKRVKQKVIYISNQRHISFTGPQSRASVSYEAHAVAGHWRTLKSEQIGKDRHDNRNQKGRTWVRPYKTGQGKEIFETIRQWR